MIWSIIKWILIMLLYSFFAYSSHTLFLLIGAIWFGVSWWIVLASPIISCYMVFPIFYVFRKHLPDSFLYFDKRDGIYGDPRWRNAKDKEWRLIDNFKTAWAWSVRRNPVDNFFLWFYATRIEPKKIRVINKAVKYGDNRDNLFTPCQIKTNNNNFGDTFEPKKSKLGWLFIVYKDKGKTYWNLSIAKNKGNGSFVEWEFGYNEIRPLLNRNRKKLKT